MAYFSGSNGAVYWKDGSTYKKIAKAVNFQLGVSQASLRTTTLEDTDQTSIPGLRSTSGSCKIFYYQETRGSNENNLCSAMVRKLLKERTDNAVGDEGIAAPPEQVILRFNINDGSDPANNGRHIEVDAIFTSATMSMAVGEIFAADLSFDVVGAARSVTI